MYRTVSWHSLFASLNISCEIPTLATHSNKVAIVVPEGLSPQDTVNIFKRELGRLGFKSVIASICITEPGSGGIYSIDHLVPTHERSAQSGTYVYYPNPHVVLTKNGSLERIDAFDTSMTLIESFWYHIPLLRNFGVKYLKVQDLSIDRCRGSRRASGVIPGLYWDVQNVTVSLK